MVWHSFDEASPATITAYERALALDPEQSEGLVTKALMTQLLENDWEAAGRLYQRAMASGDNANALVAYSLFYLAHIDKAPQAIRLTAAAEKRDPLNPGRKGIHAMILIFGGDAQAAARKAHEALELNPQYEIALATLIQAYTRTGDFEAVQELLESIPPAMAARHRIRARAGVYYALREHPRYQALLERIGLDDKSIAALHSKMKFD